VFPRELEPVGPQGAGAVLRRLPSVKTQLLEAEGVLAGKLFTNTPRLVQSTGFPAFVVFAAGAAL
jgi:hypothetical protein